MISFPKPSERDKIALTILVVFSVIIALYFGMRYSFSYRIEAADNFREDRLFLMELHTQGEEITRLEASMKSSAMEGEDQTLLILASTTAKEKKISFKRIQPDGEGFLQIWLEEANFNALLLWLSDIERKNGIHVAQISVERTKRDGFVNARITLMR